MADDTIEIIESFEFHPCDTPRGCLYYFPHILTAEQQTLLNKLKTKTIRDDEKYLARHPEVRAIVSLIIRHVLKIRPRQNVHHVIAKYFARSRYTIQDEIDEYLRIRNIPTPDEERVEEEQDEDEIAAFYRKFCAAGVSYEEGGDLLPTAAADLEHQKTEAFIRNMLLEQINKLGSMTELFCNNKSTALSQLIDSNGSLGVSTADMTRPNSAVTEENF